MRMSRRHTVGTMTIEGAKQGLLIGDVLLKGKAVVLVLFLEAGLPTSPRHTCHGACYPCCTLQKYTYGDHIRQTGRTCVSRSSQLELKTVFLRSQMLLWCRCMVAKVGLN